MKNSSFGNCNSVCLITEKTGTKNSLKLSRPNHSETYNISLFQRNATMMKHGKNSLNLTYGMASTASTVTHI